MGHMEKDTSPTIHSPADILDIAVGVEAKLHTMLETF
jgi:hypothetical protein